jgi:hypothetical protein
VVTAGSTLTFRQPDRGSAPKRKSGTGSANSDAKTSAQSAPSPSKSSAGTS